VMPSAFTCQAHSQYTLGGGRMNKIALRRRKLNRLAVNARAIFGLKTLNDMRALAPQGAHPRSISTRVLYGSHQKGDGRDVVEHDI